jgi:hypothetical protein
MVTYCTETTPTQWLVDLGFRFGGRGGGGAGGEGIPVPLGVRGLAPGKFLQMDVENMYFPGHV